MDLPDGILPSSIARAAWLPAVGALAWAAWRARWRDLLDPARHHPWLGAMAFLSLAWAMQTGVKPGLGLHLLGATLVTLMFGPELALWALALVLAGATALGPPGAEAWGANLLLAAVLPVAVSVLVLRGAERFLPAHFFVYVFVCGFLGAALAMAASGLGGTLLLALAGVYPWDYLLSDYLPYTLLLGWGEAFLTGLLITVLVIYRPAWVNTFDDARYLRRR